MEMEGITCISNACDDIDKMKIVLAYMMCIKISLNVLY